MKTAFQQKQIYATQKHMKNKKKSPRATLWVVTQKDAQTKMKKLKKLYLVKWYGFFVRQLEMFRQQGIVWLIYD